MVDRLVWMRDKVVSPKQMGRNREWMKQMEIPRCRTIWVDAGPTWVLGVVPTAHPGGHGPAKPVGFGVWVLPLSTGVQSYESSPFLVWSNCEDFALNLRSMFDEIKIYSVLGGGCNSIPFPLHEIFEWRRRVYGWWNQILWTDHWI